MSYQDLYQQSIEQPEVFWRNLAELVKWYEFPETILSQDEHGFFRWFAGGKLNTSPTVAMSGYNVQVLDDEGNVCKPGETGNIVIHLPLPPSCLPTLWNDNDRFKQSYLSRYDGYYLTGDEGIKDEDNYVFVMGRTDDVINIA